MKNAVAAERQGLAAEYAMKNKPFSLTPGEYVIFDGLISPYIEDPKILRMKDFIQHGNISTYDHCIDVAKTAFAINRRLNAGVDEFHLVRVCMLHDYFLYDWHDHGDKLHGYHHPEIASYNALQDFQITDSEQEMIRTHMWPLTLFHMPRSKGGWILTFADKICSTREIIEDRLGLK